MTRRGSGNQQQEYEADTEEEDDDEDEENTSVVYSTTQDVGGDGVIRIMISASGKTWVDQGTVSEAGVDLRDPKLLVTPDEKRLYLLCGGSIYNGGTQLKGRRQLARLRGADSLVVHVFGNGKPAELLEPAIFLQQIAGDLDHVPANHPGAQEKSDELGVAQGCCAVFLHFLAREVAVCGFVEQRHGWVKAEMLKTEMLKLERVSWMI